MKKCLLLSFLTISSIVFAQQKSFEGTIDYEVSVTSKVDYLNEKDIRAILFEPSSTRIFIKEGNYSLNSKILQSWMLKKDNKTYVRFKGIDTLYFTDSMDDTSSVLQFKKLNSVKNIQGYDCKSISIQTSSSQHQFFYAPDLYNNGEIEQRNGSGVAAVYAKETNAIWLSHTEERTLFKMEQTATRIVPGKVEDSIFLLPTFPVKKFVYDELVIPPMFKSGTWDRYVSLNIDANLAGRYVKLPKGQNEARQTVWINFMINSDGAVVNAEVSNKKEVHPKLAQEALRVVASSPNWKPATIFGEKTIYSFRLPIVFVVTK